MKNIIRSIFMLFLVATAIENFAQTPSYIYYVPLPEQQIDNAFKVLYTGTGNTYHTVISIVPSESNIKIYYDQWEDGYEPNLGVKTQTSTQIWGDNNPANGMPPGYTTDVLVAGKPIVLENDVVLPRDASVLRYDGRDKFGSTQSLAVSRSSWALNPGPVLADATEFYNTKTFGTFFYFPIGQNTPSENSFSLVSLCIQASQNATQVLVDKDGNGTTDVTAVINEGESMQVNGGIMSGGTVTSSKPVQVSLITGKVGGTYASRWYSILPYTMWDKSYYTPVGTQRTDARSDVFLFNPQSSALTIYYQVNTGPGSFSIPSKGVYRFFMPLNSSAHFHSTLPFYAIGACDMDPSNNVTWDWGYTLVPEGFLTNSVYVGWGPGCAGSPILYDGNPVWVSTTEDVDNLTVYIDLDGDPTTGVLTDINGNKYDFTRVIAPYTYTTIYNPSKDQTGMHIYTVDGRNIAAAWGEDALIAGPGNPFLDVGTTIPPDPAFIIKKAYKFSYDPLNNHLADLGDTILYTLRINNYTLQPYTNIYVYDTLPSQVTYVPNSTYYDLIPLPDQTSPNTPFPLDQTGYLISLLPAGARDSVYFKCKVTGPLNSATILNRTVAIDNFGSHYRSNVKVPNNYNPTACTINFTNAGGTTVTSYDENQTIYIKVTDGDNNQNPVTIDSVKVTVTASSGDSELLYLLETGNNTGIFTRSLPSSKISGAGINDGTLKVAAGNTIGVTYTDLIFGGTCTITNFPITGPSFRKPLYLSDSLSATGMDRILPWDNTVALSSVIGGTTTSPSVAVFTKDDGSTDGKYSTYSSGTFGSDATFLSQNNPEFFMEAKCPTRNEILVAVQTNAAGLFLRKWDGSAWTDPSSPLTTPVVSSAGVTNTYRGSYIAYEQVSGNAVFVWSDNSQAAGNKLRYSVWNGTTWTSPASIAATGNTATPMFIHMASKPGANEIMLVVAFSDANHSNYALIWNGTSWANSQVMGTDASVDYSSVAAAYTSNGTGFALHEASSAGARANYYTWSGTVWSGTSEINSGLTLSGFNKWIVLASNPGSNYLLAGFITTGTAGNNMWFAIWNGTAWSNFISATLAPNLDRKAIAVATEITSGKFLAVYSTDATNGTKYRIFTPPSTWSAETTGPTTGGVIPTVQQLYSKPSSNNIMWMASNTSSDLFASEWNGTSFATSASLSTGLLTPSKQPFAFWYGNSVTGLSTITFTQNPVMCSNLTLATGGQIKVKLYLKNQSNVAGSTIDAVIKNNGTAFTTLSNTSFTDNTGNKNDTLVITGSSPAQTINAGSALSMDVNIISGTASFQIGYDSLNLASMLRLPVTNVIDITSYGVYNAANPGGSPITNAVNGATVYVRATVSDPFGIYDIHDVVLRIIDPTSGYTDTPMTQVSTSGCTKTYEYKWVTGVTQGNFTLRAIASEGYENAVKDTAQTVFNLQFQDSGTPCSVSFTDNTYVNDVTSYPNANGTLYFVVQDLDQNTNPLTTQTVNITVSSSSGDLETVTLTESDVNTGIFRGTIEYVVSGAVTQGNGTMTALPGAIVYFNYTDPDTPSDICTDNVYIAAGVPALTDTKVKILPTGLYAVIGDTVRWQITVTNPGTTAHTNISLTDIYYSTCLTFSSASITPTSQVPGTPTSSITWNTAALGGTLSPTQSVILTVTFIAASGCGATINTATATATGVTAVATSTVTVDNPQLTITKTRTSPINVPVYVGNTINFQIVATNTGNTTALTVPLVDTYSDYNLNFVSATPAASSGGAGQINWANIGPIVPAGSATVTVTFTALHGNEGLYVINNASVDFGLDNHDNHIPSVNDSARLYIFSPPVAINDIDSTVINTAVTGTVMGNDYDDDGVVISVTPNSGTAGGIGGTFTINSAGVYTYTPPTNTTGVATFTYQLCDPNARCVTATVTITVLSCFTPPPRPDEVH